MGCDFYSDKIEVKLWKYYNQFSLSLTILSLDKNAYLWMMMDVHDLTIYQTGIVKSGQCSKIQGQLVLQLLLISKTVYKNRDA